MLDEAIRLASVEGLDGLSLGHLAEALDVSKSGLFGHWRSKEQLQLATIDRAMEQWVTHVVSPALTAPRGVRRLWALHERRIAFYAEERLPGGCFFANADFEFNARTGVVRDRLAELFAQWIQLIQRAATEAVELGELRADVDVRQLGYEVEALGLTAVMHARLLSPEAYAYARRAVLERLRALSSDPYLLPTAA